MPSASLRRMLPWLPSLTGKHEAMINFDQIPGNEFWNNIEVDPYAPEFNCDYFIGRSYLEILDTLKKYPEGEYMTLSLSYIPSVESFYFYSYCIWSRPFRP